MKKINKGAEPVGLKRWKSAHPEGCYSDLSEVERQNIREACAEEQFYLCAYCCQKISGQSTDTINEHVETRKIAPHRSLDFNNIVASCATPNQCDAAHGSCFLPLTPLMDECETELRFKISGRVEGLTKRAKESIRVLNLGDTEKNNKKLIEKRKQLSSVLLLANGVDPDDGLEDDALIRILIDDLGTPINGKLESFSPVVVNILKGWLLSDYVN